MLLRKSYRARRASRKVAKLLHRSLLVALVSFLHGNSPIFLADNYPKAV
jgi:hypothetical protein